MPPKPLLTITKKTSKTDGFSLVELTLVILVIGILSALAIPAALRVANDARAAVAQSNLQEINKRQTLRLAKGLDFASTFGELGPGVPVENESYRFEITVSTSGGSSVARADAVPKNGAVEPVQGRVAIVTGEDGQKDTISLVCRTTQLATVPITATNCPNP